MRRSHYTRTSPLRTVSVVQALYFIVTGIWSLVGIESFQKITGPKVDIWLVKTVGVLVLVIGAVVGLAGLRGTREPEIPMLAVGSAASLAAIDVVYVAQRRIRPVYLLDAIGELALIGWWALSWRASRR